MSARNGEGLAIFSQWRPADEGPFGLRHAALRQTCKIFASPQYKGHERGGNDEKVYVVSAPGVAWITAAGDFMAAELDHARDAHRLFVFPSLAGLHPNR